jgi:UPF0755 protein
VDSLEGYLFPARYKIRRKTKAQAVIGEMLRVTERELALPYADAMRARRQSMHEALTVASMIEREARFEKDRAVIASVIYNRLRVGMKLNIDATVQYALGNWKTALTYGDLKRDSPYNTYKYLGLPPGPICSPGTACLRAALHPARTNFIYYVAFPTGYHKFTVTPAEHEAAVREARAAWKAQERRGG